MDKTSQAGEMLFHFSKLLRATLSRSDQFVTLREEIETIGDYVQLQKLRYPDGFEIQYQIGEHTWDCEIPSFILQPLVENAIFHNEGLTTVNTITISSELNANESDIGTIVEIMVRDEGIGMDAECIQAVLQPALPMNRIGLQNVQERIKLNYGSQFGLTIQSKPNLGTDIIIRLPARKTSTPSGTGGQPA
jgi:two-component system sensor histidine kinase YesM